MKNIIKKISAVAMAFTLLGAGTAITKKVAPKANNNITAQALCQFHRTDNVTWKRVGGYWYPYCNCCGNINWKAY